MRNSSACHSALLLLTFTAAAAGGEGPPRPDDDGERPREKPGTVLVLPARTPPRSPVDGGAIDLLLATALQDLGFEVVDRAHVLEGFHQETPGMDQARAAYLDMRLEDALRLARAERERHMEHRGDLLRDPALEEAELLMVQLLVALEREDEAAEVADGMLEGNPGLRLDPAEYAPQVQALWASVLERRSGQPVPVPSREELRKLARLWGVDWLALAVTEGGADRKVSMALYLVPAAAEGEPSEHRTPLGTTATWGNAIRLLLLERFPPPAAPEPAAGEGGGAGPPPGAGDGAEVEPPPWYRRWWFWTAVGVVVGGATAGAVGGYYANKDPGDPRVTADFAW
jgi:hypothetical protein